MICIYHNRDMDGWASGAIVQMKYPDIKLIGYDYGEPFPWDKIPVGQPVIMVDVSLPMSEMAKLAIHSNHFFTFIDHHISAIKDFKNYGDIDLQAITTVFDTTISACEGTWNFLYPDKPMPEAVKLLGEYDTWRMPDWKRWEHQVLPFQFGMRNICSKPEEFPREFIGPYNADFRALTIKEIIDDGKTILSYQSKINEFMCKKASFECTFEGLRAICLNGGGFSSDVFKSVYDESKHDIMMPFQFNGREWTISMYTTKDIDCSLIAKKYKGGGHKKACGFQVKDIKAIFPFIGE